MGVLPEPVRTSGQRRYSSDAVDQVAVLALAQACGFRLAAIRHLLHGYGAGVRASRRWQELAHRKRQEVDLQIARLKAMRRLLDRVYKCQCVEVAECGRIAAAVMESAR